MMMKRAFGHSGSIVVVTLFLCILWVGLPASVSFDHALAETTGVAGKESAPKDEYLIGAGDVLEIVVWREPDISRTVSVRPDGKISLPLVDDVQAANGTLLDLKQRLTEALVKFVDEPSVYVMLQENQSKRFYVIGKVIRPGQYILQSDTTVLQAIAMAGGFTEWAKTDDIAIIRRSPEGQFRMAFDYNDVVSGKKLDQNVFLSPEDVIIVP
jgi:polysaccharide export outer membrane protein